MTKPTAAAIETTVTPEWSVRTVAGWCIVNLAVLTFGSLGIAAGYDGTNSATPASDGVLLTLLVLAVLLLGNSLLFCLSPQTYQIGIGLLVGTLVAVPVGFVAVLFFLFNLLRSSPS